jgi:hypothetical protein
MLNATNDTIDKILTLQIMVAGEGGCEPKRLDWWRTNLIDEYGGGDLLQTKTVTENFMTLTLSKTRELI